MLRKSLDQLNPDPCIDLWWGAKHRRPQQRPRRKYRSRTLKEKSTTTSESETATTSTTSFLSDSEHSDSSEDDVTNGTHNYR